MTTSFSLEVVLRPIASVENLNALHDAVDGLSNDALVVHAHSLRVSLNESSRSLEPPRLAAVFVPPNLVDSSLEQIQHKTQAQHEAQPLFSRVATCDQHKLSDALLSRIHPFIAENFCIKAILSLRDKQNDAASAAADVVLLDLSHSPMAAITNLLDVTNSCTMKQDAAGTTDAILKILLLTQLRFARTETTVSGTTSSTSTASLQVVMTQQLDIDIASCPVCLFRIDPQRLGMPAPPNHHVCSKFCPPPNLVAATDSLLGQQFDACPRQRLLRPWAPPSHCVACHMIETYWKEQQGSSSHHHHHHEEGDSLDTLFCCECAMQETLWVCLTCGFVGCGRYSNKHAAEHFLKSRHPHSLELATLRIWDYVTGEFAHRMDLLECSSSPPLVFPWIRRPRSASRSAAAPPLPPMDNNNRPSSLAGRPPLPPNVHDEKSPKKATMIGEEYEALLQSALEDQAQHYEGEIMRLRAALTEEQVDAESMSRDELDQIERIKTEIQTLRSEIDGVGRQLLDSQAQEAGHRATSQRLLREQQVSQQVLKKIQQESAAEHEQGAMQVEEFELQIADLTANQQMRDQFSHSEELANAQIFGTTVAEEPKTLKKGKKLRRFFRK